MKRIKDHDKYKMELNILNKHFTNNIDSVRLGRVENTKYLNIHDICVLYALRDCEANKTSKYTLDQLYNKYFSGIEWRKKK